jgi:hypothetical protein
VLERWHQVGIPFRPFIFAGHYVDVVLDDSQGCDLGAEGWRGG